MTTPHYDVTDHYTSGDLETKILAALEKAGKNINELTLDDLAAVDEFHIRGRAATEELASWANVRNNHLLLDVGVMKPESTRSTVMRPSLSERSKSLGHDWRMRSCSSDHGN